MDEIFLPNESIEIIEIMTTLNTINTSSEKLNSLIEALKKGELDLLALDELVSTAQSIYETALVLRYKAYEQKVFGTEWTEKEITSVPTDKGATNERITESTKELPLFDLSFDSEEALTSVNEVNFHADKLNTNQLSEVQETIEENWEESSIEDTAEDNQADSSNHEATEFKKSTTLEHSYPEEFLSERTEEIIIEEIALPNTEPHTESSIAPADIQANIEFIQRHKTISSEEMAQIRMTKLDTLVGSFGLNERLQYINELFKGSSEDFSTAVKELDKPVGFEEVLMKASVYAVDFSWEKDSETVADFLLKLKRRHA